MTSISFEKHSQGIVSLGGLVLAVVLGVVLGGVGSLLPAQTGGFTGRCDWGLFPNSCRSSGSTTCDNSRCRNDPDCLADCERWEYLENYCQNPDPLDPNLCCQCTFRVVACKCTKTERTVYIAGQFVVRQAEGRGRCVQVQPPERGAECPLPEPPP